MSDTQATRLLSARITSSFDPRWNDAGSGATLDGGFWHPRSEGEFRPLGSVVVGTHRDINGSALALLVAANTNMYPSPVASPLGYSQVWDDEGSKAKKNGSFWRPVPPNGYVSLGDVAVDRWSPPPSVHDVWCLRSDLVMPTTFGSESIWDDRKSGAKKDVSVWEIRTHFPGNAPGSIRLGAMRANESYSPPSPQFAFQPAL